MVIHVMQTNTRFISLDQATFFHWSTSTSEAYVQVLQVQQVLKVQQVQPKAGARALSCTKLTTQRGVMGRWSSSPTSGRTFIAALRVEEIIKWEMVWTVQNTAGLSRPPLAGWFWWL